MVIISQCIEVSFLSIMTAFSIHYFISRLDDLCIYTPVILPIHLFCLAWFMYAYFIVLCTDLASHAWQWL